MKNLKLTVLNPGGRDKEQYFNDFAGTPGNGHPPVNYHAFAACTRGSFQCNVKNAIELRSPVLILINKDLKNCLTALQAVKKSGLIVAVSLKETGTHQFVETFLNPKKLFFLKEILSTANGIICTTKAMLPICKALINDYSKVEFIPTPYPIEDERWNFSTSLKSRNGIFLGTRELKKTTRNHFLALIALSRFVKENNIKLGIINKDGNLLLKVLNELKIPRHLIEIKSRMTYIEYLKFISKHRLVFQMDQSSVPGQVAGDTLLCRSLCIGGNGIVETTAFPKYCKDFFDNNHFLKNTFNLLNNDLQYSNTVAQSQKNALELLSYSKIAEKLEKFYYKTCI